MELSIKINLLLKEMKDFRIKNTESWKPAYDEIIIELQSIDEIIDVDLPTAYEQFKQHPISRYENFQSYIYNTNVSTIPIVKGIVTKTKLLRSSKSTKRCENCGSKLTIVDGKRVCGVCNYEDAGKRATGKVSVDSAKYVRKKLDMLDGSKKPPMLMAKISTYFTIWLTDLKFIKKWISRSCLTYDNWVKAYATLTKTSIDDQWFNKVVERIPANSYSYAVFKLFSDEFNSMLQLAKNISKQKSSNMESLPRDDILEIMESWMMSHDRLPISSDTIQIEDITYEIGLYIGELSLIYTCPETHIKNEIDAMLHTNITLPGLMFNFRECFTLNNSVPEKYTYKQQFTYLMHVTFNIPYINMSQSDKNSLEELIVKFNTYFKSKSAKHTCNAPLCSCTLSCIMELEHFKKYTCILKNISTKEQGTSQHIIREWINFVTDNKEYIAQFMHE